MTREQAKEVVLSYEAHAWAYEVADDGTVYIGGQYHFQALDQARVDGYDGPYVRVYGGRDE